MPTRNAANYADFVHADERYLTANRCFSKAGLADHATAHEDVLTANAITYSIGGILYSKAAVAKIDLSTLAFVNENGAAVGASAQAAGTTRVYLLAIDKDGTIAVVGPTFPATGTGATLAQNTATGAGNVPGCPAAYAPFGAIKVVNGSANPFTLGTTPKTDAGIAATYFDVTMAPEYL